MTDNDSMKGYRNLSHILMCPSCGGDVQWKERSLACDGCFQVFEFNEGVMNLLPSNLEQNKLNENRLHELEEISRERFLRISENRDFRFFRDEFFPRHMPVGDTVLEIGGGSCWMSAIVKLEVPWTKVISSDVSPYALQKARYPTQETWIQWKCLIPNCVLASGDDAN